MFSHSEAQAQQTDVKETSGNRRTRTNHKDSNREEIHSTFRADTSQTEKKDVILQSLEHGNYPFD